MEALDIIKTVEGLFGVLMIIIGYFLKGIHSKLEKTSEMTNRNYNIIQLMQSSYDNKIENLTGITELQLGQLSKEMKELKRLVTPLVGSVAHMDTKLTNFDKISSMMLDKLDKIK